MAKDFESLKQQALVIKNEVEDGANNTERVGGMLEDIVESMKLGTCEFNVSSFYPTSGISGGNKYTLETAIAQVPAELRSSGLTVSFLNESGNTEKWEFSGGSWVVGSFEQVGAGRLTDLSDKSDLIYFQTKIISGIEEQTYSFLNGDFNEDAITYGNVSGGAASVGDTLYITKGKWVGYTSFRIPIVKGMKITISGIGGGNVLAYYLTNIEGTIIEAASSGLNTTTTNKTINIQEDGFLIYQTATTSKQELLFVRVEQVDGLISNTIAVLEVVQNYLWGSQEENFPYNTENGTWVRKSVYGNKEHISFMDAPNDISTSVYHSLALRNMNGKKIVISAAGGTTVFPLYIFADKDDKIISVSEQNLNTFDSPLEVQIPHNVHNVYINSKLDATHTSEDVYVNVLEYEGLYNTITEETDSKIATVEEKILYPTNKINEEYGIYPVNTMNLNASVGTNGVINPSVPGWFYFEYKPKGDRYIELNQIPTRVIAFTTDTITEEGVINKPGSYPIDNNKTLKTFLLPNPIQDVKLIVFVFNTLDALKDTNILVRERGTTIYNIERVNSRLYNKNIVWVGTSIPAVSSIDPNGDGQSYSYPLLVGKILGANVYNESLGSSGCRAGVKGSITEDDPNGWKGLGSQSQLNLSLTMEEGPLAAAMNGLTATGHTSYEYKLIQQYFDESHERFLCMADYLIFNHGRNDWKGGTDAEIFDQIPEDLYDRTTFIGSVNYVIRECLKYNSKLKVMFIGHFQKYVENDENQTEKNTKVDSALTKLSELWQAPYLKLYEKSQMGFMKILSDGYWGDDDSNYGTKIWHEHGYSGGYREITQFQMWNPTSETTGATDIHPNYKAIPHLAEIIADWMAAQ